MVMVMSDGGWQKVMFANNGAMGPCITVMLHNHVFLLVSVGMRIWVIKGR